MSTNIAKTVPDMMHEAIENVVGQARKAGVEVTRVTLTKRFAPEAGEHVHATASARVTFRATAQNSRE